MNKKFLSMRKIANCEKGALLLGIIVTIVIFAVLGVAMLSITSTSTFTQVYGNDATKAYYMAESGYRYASIGIVTIGKGDDNCLKCHSSHGKDTIRSSAADTKLSDDTIKIHGEPYPKPADPDLLDGGAFTVRLAPYWFEAERLDDVGTGFNLTVSAVAHSSGDPQCDFPEEFTDGTITGGGLYVGAKYVSYTSIIVPEPGDGTLTFTDVNPGDIPLQEDGVFFDVIPACIAGINLNAIKPGDDLVINATAEELYAFPNTKGVIEINIGSDIYFVTYDNVDTDNGKFIGLGNVDEDVFGDDGLSVNAGDIVTLSKTLKVTSTGRYADAEKILAYYRWVGQPIIVPIVYNTAEPDENELLAGGNFHWVSDAGGDDDAKGHNVFRISGVDGNLGTAPGQTAGTLGVCMPCHKNMTNMKYGCKACHFDPHPDTIGDEYCFLIGRHFNKVTGNKDKKDKDGGDNGDWQYSKSSSDHNEYRGIAGNNDWGSSNFLETTTGYCTGCHGVFRRDQKNADDKWIRHPSDWVIDPNVKPEFVNAFEAGGTGTGTYDPNVPVARPNAGTFSWAGDPDSNVYLGEDMVMCLSCHVAHGSQYADMLRWDYDDMIVGNTGAAGKGCFQCHTMKIEKKDAGVADGQLCDGCHTMHDSQNGISVGGTYPHLLNGVYVSDDRPHKP